MTNIQAKNGHYNNARFFYCPITQTTSMSRRNSTDLYFQSRHEFQVYREIRRLGYGNLRLQLPILLKPGTERFRAIYWRIDFCVLTEYGQRLLIEAKGEGTAITREFKRDISLMEYQSPDAYRDLIFVSNAKLDYPDITCVNLKDLPKVIQDRLKR
jgi:hypothetical protein